MAAADGRFSAWGGAVIGTLLGTFFGLAFGGMMPNRLVDFCFGKAHRDDACSRR
jgi:hypothetical protein